MNSPIFLSSMAPFLNQFVQYKRALNRKYCADAEVLRLFDRYIQSRQITGWLGSVDGCPALALPAFGSFLFSAQALPDLEAAELGNDALLKAVH